MRPRPAALVLAFAALALGSAAVAACSQEPTPTVGRTPGTTPTVTQPPQSGTTPSATQPPPVGAPLTEIATPVPLETVPDAPQRDWLELVERYTGVSADPLPSTTLYRDEEVGASQTFWVLDVRGPQFVSIDATLRHVSDVALWYVADGNDISQDDLRAAAREFDRRIAPVVIATFAPSIELPGKITIVNTELPSLAGYFSGGDTLPKEANRFSNERLGMFMNPRRGVSRLDYLGTLAHELQHLVSSLVDPTEDTWISEGLAELAARSLDLPAIPYQAYFEAPTVSLSNWPEEPSASLPNYAGGALFATYLAHRTGIENVHILVAEALDGSAGIQTYLDEVTPGLAFDSLFADWAVANVVGARSGRFSYSRPPGAVLVGESLEGPAAVEMTVPQLGASYTRINPGSGPLVVRFKGASTTPLLPVDAHGGEACWWSNQGNSIDATLTRELDLSGLDRATLRFWSWHEIEEEWDRAYVAVSTDAGVTWQALDGNLTTREDRVGSALGPSYTGQSDGWHQEEIDLSDFAGEHGLLRFNYVTDESISGAGWCVDDFEIPEVGFSDDAETTGDWQVSGFTRATESGIAQRFALRLIFGVGDDAVVQEIALNGNSEATFTVDSQAVFTVAALTPKTTQPARFTLTVTRP